MPQTIQPKTKREYRKMYLIFTPPGGSTETTYVLGRDTDDMSREYSWEENDVLNVLGEFTSTNKISGNSVTVDPFYARRGDSLFGLLCHFDETSADLDDIKVKYGEVVLDLEATSGDEVIYAFTQDAYLLIQSVGGPSSDADSLPFNIKLVGKKESATYDIATEQFS